MYYSKPSKKSTGQFERYNLQWMKDSPDWLIELTMIAKGGKWTKSNGEEAGKGLFFHYRRFQEIVWPGRLWESGPFKNHWAEACLENWINHTYLGVMGCAGSGKSDSFGSIALTEWYARSKGTTVLVSSTDLKSLELRIWGMVKKYHKMAKEKCPSLPGHLIEGKQMLVLDPREEASEGRDFKNGIIAVACKRGSQFVGLGSYIGIHNTRVRLIGDEMNLMPRGFLDSISNLSKCEDFKFVGLGNPNETTNAHGVLCEPHPDLGGWDSGIDQQPGTKTWKTKFPNGIALQLPGSDTPNKNAPEDVEPPFPFLITMQQMKNDAEIWGVDDWHYTMMNEARMPRGQGSRRVITHQMAKQFDAFERPLWRDSRRTSIAFLDAAYRGVGGDRCVFGELVFGFEASQEAKAVDSSGLVYRDSGNSDGRMILHLVDVLIIPVKGDRAATSPEDQIVQFVKEQCDRREIPPQNFFFDSGMRTSLVTSFSRLWSPMVNSIDCGGRPSENWVSADIQKTCREYYDRKITEIWFTVRLIVESGQFRGMTFSVCNEFAQREWKTTMGNKISVETKEEMKEKCGKSPDLADAVAIGCHGALQRGFVIKRARKEDNRIVHERWKTELIERARKLHASGSLNFNA